MNLGLQFLFGLDQKIRTYLRFVIETCAVVIVYVVGLAGVEALAEFGLETHFLNLFAWGALYKIFGLNRDRIRFSSLNSYYPILKISLALALILAAEALAQSGRIEFFATALFFLTSFNILVGLRLIARQIIRRQMLKSQDNVLVYGTSDIAIDLANAMAFGKKYNVIGFISETSQNFGSLAGLPVIRFENLESFAISHDCRLVVIAEKHTSTERRTEILLEMDKLGLSVSYAPTMDRAFDYEVQLKAVKPEDVLGRGREIAFDEDINSQISEKTILVTGGGGSIGSEICRQILRYKPKALIVLESSEFALYTLEQELSVSSDTDLSGTQVAFRLGSINDEAILSSIFQKFTVDIIYHAAAYKHVPIVEENVIAGIYNNVFGTKLVAEFADRYRVSKFVLISSDKAVRPTNVMGATKRLAELVIQNLSKTSETIFTMVRFGNVLGSSGSVIPKFKSQINAGGPITVTHEQITRYFMSMPEAAHLVLNAGVFSKGGDVFLLDMGDPVKIVQLAKSMVRQHGLQPVLLADLEGRQKRDNEILIEFTGLRPGEKLYEELLIDGVVEKTPNAKIFVSRDGIVEDLDLPFELLRLEKFIKENSISEIIEILQKLPLSFKPVPDTVSPKPHDKCSTKNNQIVDNVSREMYENSVASFNQDRHSVLHKFVTSKIGSSLLHKYFLVTRGMTLGVRVLVLNQHNQILLVKHTYVSGWHLPGGGVDYDEDVVTAARREVFEETGISELSDLQFVSLKLNRSVSRRDHVSYFKARTSENIVANQSLEIAEQGFFSFTEASNIIAPEYLDFIRTHT